MILPASSIEDSDRCVLSYHASKALEITHRFMRLLGFWSRELKLTLEGIKQFYVSGEGRLEA